MVSGFVAKRLRPHEVMVHSEKAGLAARLLSLCEERGITLATAESLTGGMLVARLVDVPGASAVVQGGVCTYSFDAKASLLGLDRADLDDHGAVRESVARDMASGAARVYSADLALATTGVAGPGPDPYGVAEGTAFIACSLGGAVTSRRVKADGGRAAIRAEVVDEALRLGIATLSAQ